PDARIHDDEDDREGAIGGESGHVESIAVPEHADHEGEESRGHHHREEHGSGVANRVEHFLTDFGEKDGDHAATSWVMETSTSSRDAAVMVRSASPESVWSIHRETSSAAEVVITSLGPSR